MKNQNQNYINHIALVLDASGSMDHLASAVVKVADNQVEYLARRSKELDQETRATIYTFDDNTKCVYYDKDVLRMPSLKGAYEIGGSTALIDATIQAIDDLSQTPELYGDHAFLVYVLTDGEENRSRKKAADLARKIGGLKDNWTIACFVPDANGKFEAKKFGFPTDNIAVWDTSSRGMSEVAKVIRNTTDNFMNNRAKGVRGTKNLFNMDVASINKTTVTKSLNRLHPGQYRVADVQAEGPIAPFVEKLTKRAYKLGEAFYQLSKPEKVQAGKSVALYDVKSKAVYIGAEARKLLGLPDYEVKVAPASHPEFWIFIQSTSVNRKLMPGTKLLILS
jgi:hypothetical protein